MAQRGAFHFPTTETIRQKADLRLGMSMIEIMVVATLASMVLLGASILMTRTTRTFRKGTDMLNTQVLMDNIIERMRSDVRSLQYLVLDKSKTSTQIQFVMAKKSSEVTITYTFDQHTHTLFRSEVGGIKTVKTNFHGAGQVISFLFKPMPSAADFKYLTVAMQLVSGSKKGTKDTKKILADKKVSRLSIVTQFYSRCLKPQITLRGN